MVGTKSDCYISASRQGMKNKFHNFKTGKMAD
jgi:hypothetical protein